MIITEISGSPATVTVAPRMIGVQPIARGVCEDTGVIPWQVLYRSDREMEMYGVYRDSLHRAVMRIMTVPIEDLGRIPLLSNEGSMQLPSKPFIPRDNNGRFAKKK